MVYEFLDVVDKTEQLPLRIDFRTDAVIGFAIMCSRSNATLDGPSAGDRTALC